MKLFITFLVVVAIVEMTCAKKTKKCRSIMKREGLSNRFPGAVAHGIHSITLEDIQHYFKANATENNKVPTLNYDLKSSKTVLPNAPLYGYDTSFHTMGMRYVDQVLRKMDNKNWYLTNYNPLEQMVHTLHMAEVWSKTKVHYDRLSKYNVPSEVCTCVNDVNKNGVIKMLNYMAMKIRYPGFNNGKLLRTADGGTAEWSGNIYTYHFMNKMTQPLATFDFGEDMEENLKNARGVLTDDDPGLRHLDSEEEWNVWKAGMKSMVDQDDYELAMFLYCALNK